MQGIQFGSYHSFDDFGLVLSSKEIGTPEPKTITIDVEGSDGVLDFTEFAGQVKFRNRKLVFNFSKPNILDDFMQIYSEVVNALHGKKMNISLDEDSGFYYVGRITVNEFTFDANIGRIVIECDCEPWKYKNESTKEIVFLYGKNIFDKTNIERGALNAIVGETFEDLKSQNGSRLRSKYLLFVKSNTRYTLTIPSGFQATLRQFDKNCRMISADGWRTGNYSFSTSENAYSIALMVAFIQSQTIIPSDIENVEIQLEEGAAATEYEPFLQSKTVDVSLNNLNMAAIPLITASGNANIYFEGTNVSLNYSSGRFASVKFHNGINALTITGNGAVAFEYQEGGL